MKRKLLWFLVGFVVVVVVATIGGGLYFRQQLRASLPLTDGNVALSGLTGNATAERDALGIPTVTATTRADAAQVLGFLHGQDRFFQMDLQRRQAAGELSGLVGARALEADRAMRVHRFRAIARAALEKAAPSYRAILEAYARGVNQGLGMLAAPPPEYLVLRATPELWKAEDAILTVLAMFNTLQGRQASFEATFGAIADHLPGEMYQFLTARGSEWDAPVVGERLRRPPIPGSTIFNLHDTETRLEPRNSPRASAADGRCVSVSVLPCLSNEEAAGIGSNNWAVAGSHTASGGALVANDMHLAINVPNIWYRASLVIPDVDDNSHTLRVTGVTLPGIPGVVVGSNSYVAWGFTNTGGDWSDLIVVDPDPRDPNQYLTPSGPRPIERFSDPIPVINREPEPFQSEWTIWGPIVRKDAKGRRLVQHWVAHDAERLAGDVTTPEQARSLDEALRTAAGLGIPAQNFVAGDRTGRIGWTIAGPVPRRVGFDGVLPTSWADGSRRWEGYLSPDEQPRVIDPGNGRLWTANSAVVTSPALAAIGEGGYADGIRARIIRDRLLAVDKATAQDMLSVQLDTSALFHERWRTLLLEVLTPQATQGNGRRAEFRRVVESTWTGKADLNSAAYLLVRTFRSVLSREVFGALTAIVKQRDPDFDFTRALRSEGPLWQLVTEKPLHLLAPQFRTWDEQLLAAVDTAITELTSDGATLAARTWSTFNRAVVTHPLGSAIPFAGRYVNMPADALPGDIYTPRAHSPRAGPSERMAVSPGREHEGVLHMPGGQSGHLLSPHYADQHRAWVKGEALPFLPGAAVSRLTFTPVAQTSR